MPKYGQKDLCGQGTCENLENGYRCHCHTGYKGENCQSDINECDPFHGKHPCMNGSHCNNSPGSFSCTCNTGFIGQLCEEDIDECAQNENLCLNDSTCYNTPGSYFCECAKGSGFEGAHCESNINECELKENTNLCNTGKCQDLIGSYKCICPNDKRGDHCEIHIHECDRTIQPCGDYGVCEKVEIDSDSDSNSSNTKNEKPYNCQCQVGVLGEHCEIDIDECNIDDELCEHGVCHNTVGSFICDCTNTGRYGKYCEIDIDECRTGQHDCVGNSTCINLVEEPVLLEDQAIGNKFRYTVSKGYKCECDNRGFHGKFCTEDVDECAEQTEYRKVCLDSQTCHNTFGNFECFCTEFRATGDKCNQIEQNIETAVQTTISNFHIVIFSKTYCKFSKKAKKILDVVAGIGEYHVVEINQIEGDEDKKIMDEVQFYMGNITDASTVPRVFIGGVFVGGSVELYDSYKSGELQKLV